MTSLARQHIHPMFMRLFSSTARVSPLSGFGAFQPRQRAGAVVERYPRVQVTPLTVNAVGEVLLLLQVPWNPNEVEPAAGTEPL